MEQRQDHRGTRVLVIPHDAVIGALLADLVQLAGYRLLFAADDEAPRRAIERLRPAIVLVDCDHDDACSESFRIAAAAASIEVVLFSGTHSERELQGIARRYGVKYFALPNGPHRLAQTLSGAHVA